MTFEQFQATRKWSNALGKDAATPQFDGLEVSGFVYNGGLCIENAFGIANAAGPFILTIGNSQIFGALELLERDLYDFAVAEDLL